MDDEFLQVNIEQKGDLLCGFTYDSVLYIAGNYCKARFEGAYNIDNKEGYLYGVQFLANSGGHIFMRMRLWHKPGDRPNTLRATVIAKSMLGALFGNVADEVLLRRVAARPVISNRMQSCFPPVNKPAVVSPLPKKQPVQPPVSVVQKPPVQPNADKPKVVMPDVVVPPVVKEKISQQVTSRRQTEQGRLTVNTNKINLKLYDNGVVDNDTVSVFYNGKLLLSHQRLSEKAIEINLVLDENISQHIITLFAENLGGIPPNTALVVVTAGDKRYELHSKASLEENAVLIFDYKKE